MARLSVITPIYNSYEYLERCLNSLVSQTLDDIEYVWIDNGATEECKCILKKYINKNIKLITFKNNIGYLGAIIEGIKNASSEYIAFCDSDDWLDIDYYDKLYYELINKDCDMIICPFVFAYDDKRKNCKANLTYYGVTENHESVLNALSYGSIWNCIFKKSIFNCISMMKLELNRSIFVDNLILVIGIYGSKRIALTNSTAYNYYQRANSTISKLSKKQMRQASVYIVKTIDSLVKTHTLVESSELISFLRRSIPLHILESSDINSSKLLCASKKELLALSSNCIYYNPSFLNRLFSVSINRYCTKIRIRFCFVTITFSL